ncbi:MAG: phosphatidate cytidylyltransferase [Chitinophagales bacterium]
MNNLTLRIITAVVGAAVFIGCLFNIYTFLFVFIALALLLHIEYVRLIKPADLKGPYYAAGLSVAFGIMILFLASPRPNFNQPLIAPDTYFDPVRYYLPFLIFLMLPVAFTVAVLSPAKDTIHNAAYQIMGILYIPLGVGTFILEATTTNSVQIWYALGLLFMVWTNDSFAYFSGRLFGKRKLMERISPNKTVEGFIGGVVMTILCAFIFSLFFDEINTVEWLVWGLLVAVVGTIGDLAESLLKRSLQIKDSGSILPGHGGFLDRFDAFLLVAPVSMVYMEILRAIDGLL